MSAAEPVRARQTDDDLAAVMDQLGRAAKEAAAELAYAPTAAKDTALRRAAEAIRTAATDILAANAKDVAAAQTTGLKGALIDRLKRDGYSRALLKGEVRKLDETPKRRFSGHKHVDLVLDRVAIRESKRTRVFEAVEASYNMAGGFVRLRGVDGGEELLFTRNRVCVSCGATFEEPRPILF